jgi:GntR family transcriptional regulator
MPKVFSGKRDVYIEVAERYEKYIKIGVLRDGDKLPSVRVAANELGVNPNTVQKAYTLLEEKGLICSLPKKGAFVTFVQNVERNDGRRAEIIGLLTELKEKGITRDEIAELLTEVYDDRD